MRDEDFEDFVGGPPPDPSERTWRHPSEIAAQAHADSMAALSASGRAKRTLLSWRPTNTSGLVVVGSLGAAACLTAFALFQTTVGNAEPEDLMGVAAPIETDLDLSGTATTLPTSTAESVAAEPFTAVSSSEVSASEAQPSATETMSLPMPDTAATVAHDHLISITAGADVVATGVVVDGYLMTSASAVGNRLSVNYSRNGSTQLAYLVGVDPFSDLAVFRPSTESRAGRTLKGLTSTLTDDANEQPAAEPPTIETASGSAVILASMDDDGMSTAYGFVIGTDSEGVTPEGQQLIGLLDTSIRRPDQLGSLLLTPEGTMLGLHVDTSSSLASVIPMADALVIAERLHQQGWANETWIGFMGIDQDDGVEVIDVEEDGPAAQAGLQAGDVIHFFDGAPIENMGGITAGLRRAAPGQTIMIVIERSNERITLQVTAASYERSRVSGSSGG